MAGAGRLATPASGRAASRSTAGSTSRSASRRSTRSRSRARSRRTSCRTLFGDAVARPAATTGRCRPSSTASRSSSAGPAGPARSATRSTSATRRAAFELWDRIMEAGKPHDIRPIAPCEARRIEAGIFNYGSDMTIENNPFEVMGLERLVEPQDGRLHRQGGARGDPRRRACRASSSGIEFEGEALPFEICREAPGAPRRRAGRHGHRPHLVAPAREEHRLRLAADRAGRARARSSRSRPGRLAGGRPARPRSRSSTPGSRSRSADQSIGRAGSPGSSAAARNGAERARRQERGATAVTATMIVEIALISGVTPNLILP